MRYLRCVMDPVTTHQAIGVDAVAALRRQLPGDPMSLSEAPVRFAPPDLERIHFKNVAKDHGGGCWWFYPKA